MPVLGFLLGAVLGTLLTVALLRAQGSRKVTAVMAVILLGVLAFSGIGKPGTTGLAWTLGCLAFAVASIVVQVRRRRRQAA